MYVYIEVCVYFMYVCAPVYIAPPATCHARPAKLDTYIGMHGYSI
jgi:hypothetical protein